MMNRKKLEEVLLLIKPGLAKKTTDINQTTHFIFNGDEAITFNDRICISHPFKTNFSCSVPADEFYQIITKIIDDEIDISTELGEDGNLQGLTIKGKKVKARIAAQSEGQVIEMINILDFPEARKIAKPIPKDFKEGLSLCIFSTAKDMSSPILTCLYINGGIIASTDDLRIGEYKMEKSLKKRFLLPASAVAELLKFDIVKFSLSPPDESGESSWAFFHTEDNVAFCCRLVSGQFPDYAPFLEGFPEEELELPEEIQSMIETAAVLANEESDEKEIEVIIDSGKIKCKGQNKIGWIESESRIQTKTNARFVINSSFFHHILSHTKKMSFSEGKALFKSGQFRHVIALKGE